MKFQLRDWTWGEESRMIQDFCPGRWKAGVALTEMGRTGVRGEAGLRVMPKREVEAWWGGGAMNVVFLKLHLQLGQGSAGKGSHLP